LLDLKKLRLLKLLSNMNSNETNESPFRHDHAVHPLN